MIKNNNKIIYNIRLRKHFPSVFNMPGKKALSISGFLFFFALLGFFSFGVYQLPAVHQPLPIDIVSVKPPIAPQVSMFPKGQEIASLFADDFFYDSLTPEVFSAEISGKDVTVFTTINPDIQQRMITLFKNYSPLIAAGVVVDADTGAVLAMGNYSASKKAEELLPDNNGNYCLYAGFPAASLIKIVTAAAVLENKRVSISESLPIFGRHYTLYKSQLGLNKPRCKPEYVTFEKAFSMSINPFFGKLGIQYLDEEEFYDMAKAFLFNVSVDFDLPLCESCVFMPATDFEMAELASGYNTKTTISPLHAALIAALPLSEGKIMRPFLVEKITSENGECLYNYTTKGLSKPLSKRSIEDLTHIMQSTIKNGTARKSFSHLRSLSESKNWVLGGKTGTINLPNKPRSCEWFAGFAGNDNTRIAVAIVMVHGEKRTVKPSYVAAEIIKTCLKPNKKEPASSRKRS
jgi:cell division protein FtsI/penicillin-binding protein 2